MQVIISKYDKGIAFLNNIVYNLNTVTVSKF